MSDRYLGTPNTRNIMNSANRLVSGEDLRAMKLFHEKCDPKEVKAENKTRKVTFGMKVAQNVFLGRLIYVESTAVRRTERIARFLKGDPKLDDNSRAVMEYLWERCWDHHDRVQSCGIPETYRAGGPNRVS